LDPDADFYGSDLDDTPNVIDRYDQNGDYECLIVMENPSDPDIDESHVFKTLLEYIYWEESYPYSIDDDSVPAGKGLSYCVHLWRQGKDFQVRGLESFLADNALYFMPGFLRDSFHGPIPEELLDAIHAYYKGSPPPLSALGKELTKALLSVGHSKKDRTDDATLQELCVDYPILGVDIACHYLKRGIRYFPTKFSNAYWEGMKGRTYSKWAASLHLN
jgi:hypothetical protein